MRGWLRLVPLMVMALGLTLSGAPADAQASGDEDATLEASDLPPAPELPQAIAATPTAGLDRDFNFAALRRY